jgi:O-acetyl-ADP-ribose deacetylase
VRDARRLRYRIGQDHPRLSPQGQARHYRTALVLAAEHRLASIAFPAISTGIYRFPAARAARVAVGTAAAEIARAPGIKRVVFCCFSPDAAAHHRDAFAALGLG